MDLWAAICESLLAEGASSEEYGCLRNLSNDVFSAEEASLVKA